jgi:hypothetical protein
MRMRILMAAAAAVAATLLPCGIAEAQVVINEIMADPASDWSTTDGDDEYGSLNDEWVEIMNAGSAAVDITGWRLRDAVSDSSWRFGFSGVIQPGCLLVVYGNEAYDWEDANGYPRYGLSMNNAGDTIALVAADLSTVVDEIAYASFQVLDDRSYGRLPDGGPGWAVYDALNPLNPPETGMPPTPGAPNVGSPVESANWGRIKALYR